MKKKSYITQNIKDTKLIFNDLLKIYKKIEQIKKKDDDNIVGILLHELMYFFITNQCRKNLKYFSNLIDNNPLIIFGKRNKKDVFKLKTNNLLTLLFLKFFSFFPYVFKFKNKLFLGKSISFSFKKKVEIILFCLFKGYKIIIVNFEDTKIKLSNYVEFIFLKEIKKLFIKNNINLKSLDDIKIFIKKIKTNKKFQFKKLENKNLENKNLENKNLEKSIMISGTLASIQNRLLAINCKKNNSKIIIINHIPTYGHVSYKALKYDEFYLCDHYITPGKKIISNDENYKSIDQKKYKVFFIKNKNILNSSDYVKKINFQKLHGNKILYIPARLYANVALSGNAYIYKKHYMDWQKFLSRKFGNIDAKYPSKNLDYSVNNDFNLLDSKLKLINICKKYDYVILDYISSSTFGEVASTNVPILYFNLGIDEINKDAKKIINSRVYEIKINIFDDYKGFNLFNSLGKYRKKKNIFNITYHNSSNTKSFYKYLSDIHKTF
jgi:hypothetical protein